MSRWFQRDVGPQTRERLLLLAVTLALVSIGFIPPALGQQAWDVMVQAAPRSSATKATKATAAAPTTVRPQWKLVQEGPAAPQPAARDTKPPEAATAAAPPEIARSQTESGPPAGSPARQYCANIAAAAADARFAWQKQQLAEIEQQLSKRMALLEEKTAEYQRWLARRDEFSQKAQESLVRIYSRMRADAAALQFAAMEEETAAAVLTKLDPKNASAILNDMEASKAARLTAIINGAGKVAPAAIPAVQPQDRGS
jgi:flagellar motility protein MotE (MotC chaperone)